MKKITIEYCVEWNYYPQAASLAEALKERYGISAELIKSGGGVFEVVHDNELIFSKKAIGRFPEHEEIFKKLDKSWVCFFCVLITFVEKSDRYSATYFAEMFLAPIFDRLFPFLGMFISIEWIGLM